MTRNPSAAQRAAELLPVDIGQGSLRKALLREDRERRQMERFLDDLARRTTAKEVWLAVTSARFSKIARRLRKGDKHG